MGIVSTGCVGGIVWRGDSTVVGRSGRWLSPGFAGIHAPPRLNQDAFGFLPLSAATAGCSALAGIAFHPLFVATATGLGSSKANGSGSRGASRGARLRARSAWLFGHLLDQSFIFMFQQPVRRAIQSYSAYSIFVRGNPYSRIARHCHLAPLLRPSHAGYED